MEGLEKVEFYSKWNIRELKKDMILTTDIEIYIIKISKMYREKVEGIDIETIIEITKLTKEEVKAL